MASTSASAPSRTSRHRRPAAGDGLHRRYPEREEVKASTFSTGASSSCRPDRADFVSRTVLTAPPGSICGREPASKTSSSATTIFVSPQQLRETPRLVARAPGHATHGFNLSEVDLASIDRAAAGLRRERTRDRLLRAHAPSTTTPLRPTPPAADDARDVSGSAPQPPRGRRRVRLREGPLHAKHRIVPVIGDFAGPKALRSIGVTVRAIAHVIQAFYASNVGVYS